VVRAGRSPLLLDAYYAECAFSGGGLGTGRRGSSCSSATARVFGEPRVVFDRRGLVEADAVEDDLPSVGDNGAELRFRDVIDASLQTSLIQQMEGPVVGLCAP